jgi:hypothetical protein
VVIWLIKEISDDLNKRLLDSTIFNPFTYIDPPRHWKAPFIIDAEYYLEWFPRKLQEARTQGYAISFVVGDPGAGKTHFLCHINYLFYVAKKFSGLHSIYSAGEKKITPEVLWRDFFGNTDVMERLGQLISSERVKSFRFPQIGTKETILAYLSDPRKVQEFETDELQRMAQGISNLLSEKGAYICMVIDNVDEYFRWLNSLHIKTSQETDEKDLLGVEPTQEDLNVFFGTLRNTATNMEAFLLLVACTSPIYNPIEKNAVAADRTHAGRISYQPKILGPLSPSQSYELVNKYMEHWAKENGVKLPLLEECSVETSEGKTLNLYPFSKVAIQEIREITGQYARDIKTICSKAIDDMRYRQEIWIVKDEYLALAVDEAHKLRPQIIPREKVNAFKERRVQWLKKTIELRLPELEKLAHQQYLALSSEELVQIVDSYVKALGIGVEDVSPIRNWVHPSNLTDTSNIRIWEYAKKRILASYIFSDKRPLGPLYHRMIELRDLTDAISYINSNLATHIIFITHWCGTRSPKARGYYSQLSPYDSVIKEFSIDEQLFKVIASVRLANDENERRDLVEHIDQYNLRLIENLNWLIKQSVYPQKSWEERTKEERFKDAQF